MTPGRCAVCTLALNLSNARWPEAPRFRRRGYSRTWTRTRATRPGAALWGSTQTLLMR